mgnify:CR=1 FL=1
MERLVGRSELCKASTPWLLGAAPGGHLQERVREREREKQKIVKLESFCVCVVVYFFFLLMS